MARYNRKLREERYCLCGCGSMFVCIVNSKRRFMLGHNTRICSWMKEHRYERESRLCLCGCGREKDNIIITSKWRMFRGYHRRGKSWNKGLTKEIDIRVKRNADSIRKTMSKVGYREKMRNIMINLLKDEKFVRRRLEKGKLKPNKLELKFDKLLWEWCPGEWKFTGDGGFILGGKIPDWLNVNGKKKLIELFGDFWHSDNNFWFKTRNDEKSRIEYFKGYGFDTLVIWEKELQDIESLKSKILSFSQ